MRLNKLAAIAGVTSIVVLAAGLTETIITTRSANASSLDKSTLIAEKNEVLTTGRFVRVDKSTSGGVQIVESDGKRYVELLSNFKTSGGPQLEVILHRNSVVPKSIRRADYITLSSLKSVDGNQRYLIPDNIDLKDFSSVAIWCRQFNVTFGYASI